ncbi:TetR/AcrR family transcriptional regulator [Parvibaculum sp.]|uniref:TetR/AcrR family transcriptional regulator n=1 Tax=Parvibaculum sp. TaxID=2024848 RepID=UPI002C251FC9|nr:TetR/AcrR family transcriptional regulator [Parvibaculum sp.]HUD51637.1 TetR/AcrR family transcriptional regulator [Parvibaculum sp.]
MRGKTVSSPWQKAPERKQQRALKREAVLAAAARIFSEVGYHRASLDEVARVLNVTKPTLYYYFKNKEALLFACIEHGLEMLGGSVEGPHTAAESGLQRLMSYLRRYARLIETDFGRCAVRISDKELSEPSSKKIRRIKADIDRELRQMVVDGMADGSIASANPQITAFALAGALNSLGHWRHREDQTVTDKIIDEYISLLVDGLAPRDHAKAKPDRHTR